MKPLLALFRSDLVLTVVSLLLLAGCSGQVDETDFTSPSGSPLGAVQQATTQQPAADPCDIKYVPSGATASSIEHSGKPAANAIDGNLTSRWASQFSDPQWIQLDLGSPKAIAKVVLRWEAAASSSYDIQVSNDANTWTVVGSNQTATIVGTGTSNRVDTLSGLSTTGRYVRMYSRARSTQYGNSLWEFEVYGDSCHQSCEASEVDVVSASASSIEHSGKPAANAIDGDSNTRWSSQFANPQWLALDLGGSYTVSRVLLDWEAASSAKYDIQIADAAQGPWQTIKTVQNGLSQNHRIDDITGLAASARFVRIYSYTRTTQYGVSLWEARVFANTCDPCAGPLPASSANSSSNENGQLTAAKAIDSNPSTRWSSQFSDPQWLIVDLGKTAFVRSVELDWQTSASKAYTLSISGSASGPWQQLYSKTNGVKGPRVDTIGDLSAVGRYLRIYSTARTTQYGVSLFEVKVKGGTDLTTCQNTFLLDDACPYDDAKTQPGVCGCNRPDQDSDGDGYLDCQDCAPTDPTNALCRTRDDLPERTDRPKGPDVDPVDPTDCETLPTLDENQDEPTMEQLCELKDLVPTSSTSVCEPVNALEDCPLDPDRVSLVACEIPDTSPAERDQFCQAQGLGYCRLALPSECYGQRVIGSPVCHNKGYFCGQLDADCLSDPAPSACANPNDCACDPATQGSCTQIDVCPDDGYTGPSGPADLDAYTPTTTPTPQSIADNRPEIDEEYEDDPNDPTCPRGPYGNCWCKLGMADPPETGDVTQKSATHGSGSLVSLDFDPYTNFDIDLDPMPFGEARFKLDAGAGMTAQVSMELPLGGSVGPVPILDVGAGVSATRCSLSTLDTRFMVMGIDFVDLAGDNPFDTDSITSLQMVRDACESALETLDDASNRAKKSLRDAQTLLNLYKDLPANTTFDKDAFCPYVASGDPDFPTLNCTVDPVETTLNHYIEYYNQRTDLLAQALTASHTSTLNFVNSLHLIDEDQSINFLDFKRTESWPIVNLQAFIGPIPVNLTVDIAIGYGVSGDLQFSFTPMRALSIAPDGTPSQLASIAGVVKPSADAGVEAFAGVGFDVPGFAVKAGVSGNLTLINVQGNLQAGAGLSMKTHDDDRELPNELKRLSSGKLKLPSKSYEFYLDWFYDANVGLHDVLGGTINAKVKLKALFISKTFQKTLWHFDGYDLGTVDLISGGGRLADITLPSVADAVDNSMGVFQMQLPFVELDMLQPRTTTGMDQVPLVLPPDVTLMFDGVCNEPCGPGEIRRGNDCIPCAPNEIVVGNACVPCEFGTAPEPSQRRVCALCAADASLNLNACTGGSVTVNTQPLGDNCPDQLWVDVNIAPGFEGDRGLYLDDVSEAVPAGQCSNTLLYGLYLDPVTREQLGLAYAHAGIQCVDVPACSPGQSPPGCCEDGPTTISCPIVCEGDACDFDNTGIGGDLSSAIPSYVPNHFRVFIGDSLPDVNLVPTLGITKNCPPDVPK